MALIQIHNKQRVVKSANLELIIIKFNSYFVNRVYLDNTKIHMVHFHAFSAQLEHFKMNIANQNVLIVQVYLLYKNEYFAVFITIIN